MRDAVPGLMGRSVAPPRRQPWACLVWAWVCLLSTLLPASVWAGDLITERAWLADPLREQTVAQVSAREDGWQTAPEVLSRGYTDDILWLRLRVDVPRANEALVLRLRPSFLDRVTVYLPDPARPGAWLTRETGDTLPIDTRDRASAALAIVWAPDRAGLQTVYVQVHTTSAQMIAAQVLSPRNAQFQDHRLDLFLIAYLSVMLAMGLWAVFDHALQRHPLNFWFMATQTNAVVFALSVLGYMAVLLPSTLSTLGHQLTSLTVCLSTMLHLGFYRAALAENQPSVWSRRVVSWAMALCPVQLVLILLGDVRPAVESNALVATLIATPLLLWMVASSTHDGLLNRRIWWVVTLTQMALTVLAMLPLLGWRAAAQLNLQASLFFGLSSAVLMLVVLMLRSRRLRHMARRDRLQLDLAEQRLQLAQRQQADQQQFLDMLGHELKTPLMTIRLAQHALQRLQPDAAPQIARRLQHIDASAAGMEQVLERVMEANRLGDTTLPLNPQRFVLGDVVEDAHAAMSEPDRLRCHGALNLQVHTDAELLRVIVSNLLDNACKYSPPDSPITARVSADDRRWCLQVRNAVGSAGAPDPDQVFRKYHRAEEAKGLAGAGLGLWLGHNLAQRLGGTLGVQTVNDHVEFKLCLPLTTPP